MVVSPKHGWYAWPALLVRNLPHAALERCGASLCWTCIIKLRLCSTSPCMCITYQILPHCMCGCILFPPPPKLTEAAPPSSSSVVSHTPTPHLWPSVRPGCSPVVRPALNAGLLPSNYQLPGSTSTPGAGQTRNELSPLGWTAGWAVYGGGWALPSGGVNGPTRGAVSRRIHHIFWLENELHAALLFGLGCLFLVSTRVIIWHRRCPFWWFTDLNLLTREGICRIAEGNRLQWKDTGALTCCTTCRSIRHALRGHSINFTH